MEADVNERTAAFYSYYRPESYVFTRTKAGKLVVARRAGEAEMAVPQAQRMDRL